jgi:multidrug transporter EmrE-like cation transporter
MNPWIWLGVALVATAAGQVLFKYASSRRSRPLVIATILLFCLVPPASFLALRGLSLATVYISTALAQLLAVGAAMAVFGERYSRFQWIGLALILFGVGVFNFPAFL